MSLELSTKITQIAQIFKKVYFVLDSPIFYRLHMQHSLVHELLREDLPTSKS